MVIQPVSKWKMQTKHLVLCYVIAVLVRFSFIAVFPGINYFGGISETCLNVAKNVVEGRGYVVFINVAPLGQPDHYVYEPFINKPIGYPTFLAAIFFITGYSPVLAQIIQTLLVSIGVIFIYKISLLLGLPEKIALIASLLGALWPNHARFEVTLLPEAMMPLVLLITCYLIMKALKMSLLNEDWDIAKKYIVKKSLLAGLVLGIGVLFRPDVVFLPIFLLFLFSISYGFKKCYKIILYASIVFYSIIGLHTIRNYALTNEIIPLGYSNGAVMWEGISQFGDTLGTVYSDYRMAQHEGYPNIMYPNGIARDRKRFSEAVEIIKEHPIFYLSLIPRRIPLLLVPRGILVQDDPAPRVTDKEDFPQHFSTGFIGDLKQTPLRALVKIFSALSGVLLIIVAFAGFWKFRKKFKLIYPLAFMALYFFLVLLPINAEARYFFPAVVLLFPLAALAFVKPHS